MRILTLTLLVATMLLSSACGGTLVPVPPPNLDGVEEALGYSLAPTNLPEGFEFVQYQLLGFNESVFPSTLVPYASILYQRFKDYASHSISIMYPSTFPPPVSDNYLLESLGLEWQRPDNAVSEVEVNGETAYLVRGSWSTETLRQLNKPDPELLAEYTPVWD